MKTIPTLADEYVLAIADASNQGLSVLVAHQYFGNDLSKHVHWEIVKLVEGNKWVEFDLDPHARFGVPRGMLPAGWDRVGQLRNPTAATEGQTFNIAIENNSGQLAAGNANTQIQNFGINASQLATILERLHDMRLEFPNDAAFDDIEAVLTDEDEPPQAKRVSLMWLRDIAIRASGSAAGQGIIEAVNAIIS